LSIQPEYCCFTSHDAFSSVMISYLNCLSRPCLIWQQTNNSYPLLGFIVSLISCHRYYVTCVGFSLVRPKFLPP